MQDRLMTGSPPGAAGRDRSGDQLIVEGISKSFGGVRVLADVGFSVPVGGLSGLIGPNGAGKSTLFSVISGFQPGDAGRVGFAGRDLTGLSAVERVRAGMGRTFQVPRVFASLTVRQNLAAAAPGQAGEHLVDVFFRPGRIRRQEADIAARADEILGFLNLARVADTPAGGLSGGQRKLLELGRALMVRPRMILLDEPFAGVNPVLIDEIAVRIREIAAGGIGFLIVEHNLPSLSALVERMIVIDRGRLLAQGAPAEVLADPVVREAYMGGAV
jgi:branched-chain amino acid transport system ATP-binding protein